MKGKAVKVWKRNWVKVSLGFANGDSVRAGICLEG